MIILDIDPAKLKNPDADIRYVLPSLLVEKSGGVLSEDGYDYSESEHMILFLGTTSPDAGLACVLDVIKNQLVLENRLANATQVSIDDETGQEPRVVFPEAQIVCQE